jgi:hypothetical protein
MRDRTCRALTLTALLVAAGCGSGSSSGQAEETGAGTPGASGSPESGSAGSGSQGSGGGSGAGGSSSPRATFFAEDFEDTDFSARGWYDGDVGVITDAEHRSGGHSLECHWLPGQAVPGISGNWTFRHKFPESDRVYVSAWWKFSAGWVGSGTTYHPHLFLILTNQDDDWAGPAFTHLTAYVETVFGYPRLALQDGENIDQARVGADLVGVTENRSTQGCNGIGDRYTESVSCYDAGSAYWNGREWDASGTDLADGAWHHVEAYFQLNTVANGVGVADGVLTYWVDGAKVVDARDVLMRTGELPDMQFDQFMLAPYIQPGSGSPVDQTLWIDDLVVGDELP